MSYTVKSSYPDSIDDLVFISDTDIKHESVYKKHQELINNKNYTQASEYISGQTDITPITADLFNLIQNRIIAMQEYLKNSAESCERVVYGNKPDSPVNKTTWIE